MEMRHRADECVATVERVILSNRQINRTLRHAGFVDSHDELHRIAALKARNDQLLASFDGGDEIIDFTRVVFLFQLRR